MLSIMKFPIRINKYLADKGLSTRRGADALVEAGKVMVNGARAVLGQKIEESDTVEVRGAKTAAEHRYFAYHKPMGVLTMDDGSGDMDIATRIKKDYSLEGVFPIGRLDKASEGLIILTDDGRVTKRLLSPDQNREKEYLVTVDKRMFGAVFRNLENGVKIERYKTKPAKVEKVTPTTFKITITEGKKHQIRRMCAALGYQVQKLVRLRIMNITLGKTKPGQYRVIKDEELKTFLDELGIR